MRPANGGRNRSDRIETRGPAVDLDRLKRALPGRLRSHDPSLADFRAARFELRFHEDDDGARFLHEGDDGRQDEPGRDEGDVDRGEANALGNVLRRQSARVQLLA